jgi:hypothetical protein
LAEKGGLTVKKFVAGILAGVVLASTGIGVAASQYVWAKRYAGVWCAAEKGNVLCVKQTGTGYAIGINRDFVAIFKAGSTKPVTVKWH